MSVKNLVKQVLTGQKNKAYERILKEHQVSYDAWVRSLEESDEAQTGAESEDFILLHSLCGEVSSQAGKWIAKWLDTHPETLVLYGDEDYMGADGKRFNPIYKPCWSPDLFDCQFYFGNLVAVRKSFLEQQDAQLYQALQEANSWTVTQELIRQVVKLAGGYELAKGRRTIKAMPHILFHITEEQSTQEFPPVLQQKEGQNLQQSVVSVVIPSKDNPTLLEKCLKGVKRASEGITYEVLVVDNGSSDENRETIAQFMERCNREKQQSCLGFTYIYEQQEFHFSRMCNLGADHAQGDLIIFLNDDVELIASNTLLQLASLAKREYTGAVGLKLLYPDDKAKGKIQHAGIVNLPMGPVHKLQFCSDEESYYLNWNRGRHNALAVTAACLMIEKEKFLQVGGFSEELAVAFNDVDLGFALYEAGYENVCECDLYAFHDESFSRGDDEATDKLKRLLGERDRLYKRHVWLTEGAISDPYYSGLLNHEGLDTRIKPAYETAKNSLQKAQPVQEGNLASYRQDGCLLVRVESVLDLGEAFRITGYGVVLGDNNACYDKSLILRSEDNLFYRIPLVGMYREDLLTNMPDQENVGMSGYWVEIKKKDLSAGSYTVGMVADRTVGSMKLVNWTNRMVEV